MLFEEQFALYFACLAICDYVYFLYLICVYIMGFKGSFSISISNNGIHIEIKMWFSLHNEIGYLLPYCQGEVVILTCNELDLKLN